MSIKPGLHSVRRTYATEMRKRIYASHARRGVYTPRVDLGAYTQTSTQYRLRTISGRWIYFILEWTTCLDSSSGTLIRLKPGLHFERISRAYTQTILRTWGAFYRPPMPIYAVGIAQVASVNTPTMRRLLRVDAGLSLANSPKPLRIRKLLLDI